MTADVRATPAAVPSWGRWAVACGAAETLGMAAAAGAAVGLNRVVGEPHDWPSALLVWGGSIAGGVVEGLAVGLAQHRLLAPWLPRLRRGTWLRATVSVTLAGWALGMAPSSLISWQVGAAGQAGAAGPAGAAGQAGDSGPSLVLMAVVGLVGGLALGALFGAVQCRALRGHVARPRRWIAANAAGWSGALALMLVGATIPAAGWPLGRTLTIAAVTGVLAGLVVGAVTGLFLPALDDPAPTARRRVNRAVLAVLRSPAHRLLSGSLAELRYPGRRSGRIHVLPVMYALDGDLVSVVVGAAERKVWWHNVTEPVAVDLLLRGRIRHGTARVTPADDPDAVPSVALYRRRFPRVRFVATAPVVTIHLDSRPADLPG